MPYKKVRGPMTNKTKTKTTTKTTTKTKRGANVLAFHAGAADDQAELDQLLLTVEACHPSVTTSEIATAHERQYPAISWERVDELLLLAQQQGRLDDTGPSHEEICGWCGANRWNFGEGGHFDEATCRLCEASWVVERHDYVFDRVERRRQYKAWQRRMTTMYDTLRNLARAMAARIVTAVSEWATEDDSACDFEREDFWIFVTCEINRNFLSAQPDMSGSWRTFYDRELFTAIVDFSARAAVTQHTRTTGLQKQVEGSL